MWFERIHGTIGIRYSNATIPVLARRLRELPNYKWKREDAVRSLRVAISPTHAESKQHIYKWIKRFLLVIASIGIVISLWRLLNEFALYSVVGVILIQLTIFYEYKVQLRREFDYVYKDVPHAGRIIPLNGKPGILCAIVGLAYVFLLDAAYKDIVIGDGALVFFFGLFCAILELCFFWPAKYFIRKDFVSLWDDLVEYDPSLADEFEEHANRKLKVVG